MVETNPLLQLVAVRGRMVLISSKKFADIASQYTLEYFDTAGLFRTKDDMYFIAETLPRGEPHMVIKPGGNEGYVIFISVSDVETMDDIGHLIAKGFIKEEMTRLFLDLWSLPDGILVR